jgi:CheY-like chemotaxis protein
MFCPLQILASPSQGLPRTKNATSLQACPQADRQIRPMQEGLVVLIAENDRDMRGYVRRCVETHGVEIEEIIEARDGQEALEIARERQIDLVITDGAMPRLGGFELCTAVRRELTDHRTKVLVITGQFGLKDAERRAHEAGADGLLLKPFNTLMLCEKIDEVLTAQSPPGGSDANEPETNL